MAPETGYQSTPLEESVIPFDPVKLRHESKHNHIIQLAIEDRLAHGSFPHSNIPFIEERLTQVRERQREIINLFRTHDENFEAAIQRLIAKGNPLEEIYALPAYGIFEDYEGNKNGYTQGMDDLATRMLSKGNDTEAVTQMILRVERGTVAEDTARDAGFSIDYDPELESIGSDDFAFF